MNLHLSDSPCRKKNEFVLTCNCTLSEFIICLHQNTTEVLVAMSHRIVDTCHA